MNRKNKPEKIIEKNIVRDKTLILRILVPGLHTRLNDKINSIQDGEDNNNNNNNPATGPMMLSSSSSGLGGLSGYSSSVGGRSGGSGGGGKSADQIFDLEGVSCMASSSGSTLWHFRCDGATYPARLVNLPCPVEVHKTHDHATYHKAADIGQMLIVYEDEYAMEEAEQEKGYKVDGFPSYYHSGLTPPMRQVVRRRFLSRFEERDTKPIPPHKSEVSEVEKEIQELFTKISGEKGKGKQKKGGASSSSSGKERIIEEIEEEIVDYESWMGDGGTFTLEDAKMHPEWWLSRDEIKEIEEAKKAEKEKKEREEQEAKAAAEAAAAEAAARAAEMRALSPLPGEEGKTKKKKKKDKKKKKKHEEEEEVLEMDEGIGGGSTKKGIASLKSREGEEQIDEVTQAAMTISQGIDDDALMLDDDMFDFEGEDLTDLM